jgi:hypothetical protein
MGAYEYDALPAQVFMRGDANADGSLQIADAIHILASIFTSGPESACLDTADANDDGKLDIADPVRVLMHLFAGDRPLPDPYGACGADPTVDQLSCGSYAPCE